MFTFTLCMLIFYISPIEVICILGLQTTVADAIRVVFYQKWPYLYKGHFWTVSNKVGSCLLHCSFVVLVIFFPLFLSQSHSVFGIHNHVRRIYLEFRFFSSWITCAYLHIHIATSYHSSKQLVSFKVGILVVTWWVQFLTVALTSHPFHWTWK